MSLKILTVDDSRTIRLIVARAFKPFDCVVLEAEDGIAGMALAKREKPDVILLDYTMPVMDGFEVLTRLRADPDLKPTPVIMLTAEAGRDTVIKIAKLAVRDYLIKPFKDEMLIERVSRVVTLKSKSEAVQRAKRFDDPIRILVVDDKPAIESQIRLGLKDMPWQVEKADQADGAFNICLNPGTDIVLASLSLPNDGAFLLFHKLHNHASTAAIPFLGMSLRTAAAEQERARQAGFAGNITKPIDAAELKAMIARALKLETSYKYFKQCEGALALILPKEYHPEVGNAVSTRLGDLLADTVEAGGDRLIIDLSAVESAPVQVVQLVLSALQACGQLSMKHAVVARAETKSLCRSFEETQSWNFVDSFEAALQPLH
jgi:two-component system cell cycle response regulator